MSWQVKSYISQTTASRVTGASMGRLREALDSGDLPSTKPSKNASHRKYGLVKNLIKPEDLIAWCEREGIWYDS